MQRTAGKLDQSQNGRIAMGVTVIGPGKLVSAERSNRPQCYLRRKRELPAEQLAQSICKEQKGRKIAGPIEIPGIRVVGAAMRTPLFVI